MGRTKYRFVGTRNDGRTLVWESVSPIPGDSRHDEITANRNWWWRETFRREAERAQAARRIVRKGDPEYDALTVERIVTGGKFEHPAVPVHLGQGGPIIGTVVLTEHTESGLMALIDMPGPSPQGQGPAPEHRVEELEALLAGPRNAHRVSMPKPFLTHFAPYGSTNALCDETVPRSAQVRTDTGDYNDPRFTTMRVHVTCPDCLWRIRIASDEDPQGEAPGFAERERRAQAAWDATRNALARAQKRPMSPDYRAGYHQALIDGAKR